MKDNLILMLRFIIATLKLLLECGLHALFSIKFAYLYKFIGLHIVNIYNYVYKIRWIAGTYAPLERKYVGQSFTLKRKYAGQSRIMGL